MRQLIGLLILTIFFITGCNDSTTKVPENNQTEALNEDDSSIENNITENNSTLTGKVIDGEIAGATLF